MSKRRWVGSKPIKQPTASEGAVEACSACGKRHHIAASTWVMLASGDLVCSNDVCWRVMNRWYKEKIDATEMDKGATGAAVDSDKRGLEAPED